MDGSARQFIGATKGVVTGKKGREDFLRKKTVGE